MAIEVKKAGVGKAVTAWSYSRLNTYEQCPFKFKLTVVLGIKEPGSAAMERGTQVHKDAEIFLRVPSAELPESYKLLADELQSIKDNGAKAEVEVTFTKDWQPTGWFDKDAWVRIKVDSIVYLPKTNSIRIIDFKTGKNRGGYEDQIELYAIAALILYPDISNISAELWFVDSGEIIGSSHGQYTHDMLPALKQKWEDRVVPMFEDAIWPARPNNFCGFCHFRKVNSGPCEY